MLFQKIKTVVKGKHYDTIFEIERSETEHLMALPKEAFQKSFQSWNQRWDNVSLAKVIILKEIE